MLRGLMRSGDAVHEMQCSNALCLFERVPELRAIRVASIRARHCSTEFQTIATCDRASGTMADASLQLFPLEFWVYPQVKCLTKLPSAEPRLRHGKVIIERMIAFRNLPPFT